ncbi:MAG: hypothetical protein JWP87_5123 [Labilithrix sp.]|nr:hypothetical protein [Labilithrix sp.]
MTRTTAFVSAVLVALSGLSYACGNSALSSFGDGNDSAPSAGGGFGPDAGAGATGASPEKNSDLGPVDNAVILVHAAKSQAFRLCFENEIDLLPQPDSDVMPEANVVGVDVGSAVRLGPLHGPPGEVILFEEPLIRAFYPQFGGDGPTCKNLLASNLKAAAQNLGKVETDLSTGVHLLVVRGCPSDSVVKKYSVAECGADWTPTKSNLSVKEITLPGANRPSPGILPAQVVNLSQPLEGTRAGRNVVVTFGDLVAPGAVLAPVSTSPPLFGDKPAPETPAPLSYNSQDIAIYESVGFRVSLVDATPGADAGAGTKVFDESLARIQKLSSPRDVPPTYYAAASNYALLLLGDPNAKLADGGVDDDDRRKLHFLAVPVIEPKPTTETDAGTGEALDGGAAP